MRQTISPFIGLTANFRSVMPNHPLLISISDDSTVHAGSPGSWHQSEIGQIWRFFCLVVHLLINMSSGDWTHQIDLRRRNHLLPCLLHVKLYNWLSQMHKQRLVQTEEIAFRLLC